METSRAALIATAIIAAFSLLLLIISVATPAWLDGGSGSTIGIFRKCYGDNLSSQGIAAGCNGENRAPQAGLSIFGLLLLAFSIITVIAALFVQTNLMLVISLILLYFSSMFIMAAYATFIVYSRDDASYFFPNNVTSVSHTTVGYSYNLCVACHYFLWTALTILAFACGYRFGGGRNDAEQRN